VTAGALAGVRVLDLADDSAAFAGRILADLGAEVLLVEPPEGHATRRRAPFLADEPGPERGFAHLALNVNKRSVVLDRAAAAGRRAFAGLVARADVVIETVPVARRVEEALDDATLRRANPALIHASVTPFGPDGAWRDWKATDGVATAASGLAWLCGERRGPPVLGSGHPAHGLASLATATGVVAALLARDLGRAGAGAHLEVSLQEAACMATMQSATPTFWSWFGQVPRRPALSNAVACADGGHVALLVRPHAFEPFRAWAAEAGTPTQLRAEDAHWAQLYAPREGNPVSQVVLELAARYGRDAFADRAAQAETICLPVMDFPSMARHPHFVHNRQFLELPHERLGVVLGLPRSPADAMAAEIPIRRAPCIGEDTERLPAILREAPRSDGTAAAPLDPARILEGVRVVDFCWVLAGPIGTRILAALGADVIRVESSKHADGMRSQAGPDGEPHPNLGGLFNAANAGKRSLTVDLTTERGRALVRDLIARSDVVANNFRPGALDRMGFGYDALRRCRGDIVLLNLPGTHREGVWSQRPTTGNAVMAASGMNLLMGFPGQRPRGYGVAYPDFTSPYFLATAVMAALRERPRTGEGQELDLSQLSATISLLAPEWMAHHATGEAPRLAANRDPNHCPHGVFETAGEDEWCALAVASDAEWAALCDAMGRPDLARDPRFATHAARKHAEDAVDAAVRAWTVRHDRWELAERLQSLGIAAAPVEHLRDTFDRDPQLRDHYPRVGHPEVPGVEIPIDRDALRFAGAPLPVRRGPMLGEHNEAVVKEVLGHSEEEYVSLVLDGVLV